MAFELGPDGKPVEIKTSYGKRPAPPAQQPTQPPAAQPTQPPAGQGAVAGAPMEPPTAPPGGFKQGVATTPAGSQTPLTPPPSPPGFDSEATKPPRPAGGSGLFDHLEPSAPAGTAPPDGANPPDVPVPPLGDPKTSIAGLKKKIGSTGQGLEPEATVPVGTKEDDPSQYVYGWLVVIDGPGKGNALEVGPGQSILSRSPAERLCLNFGDMSITSKDQLRVIYDDRSRQFLIGPGSGASINRLNDQIVGGQMPLQTGDVIEAGETKLRFVAFCDENFVWE